MSWRIDVEADHVQGLVDKGRVVGQLEQSVAMRCQASGLPDLMDLGARHAARLGHVAHRPVRRIFRRLIMKRSPDDVGHLALFERRNARRPGLVAQQSIHAGLEIAILPSPDRRFGQTRLAHDLGGANPVRSQQHHRRPPDMLLTAIPIGQDRCQTLTISR